MKALVQVERAARSPEDRGNLRLGVVLDEIDRLDQRVRDYLDHARPVAELRVEPVDLGALVDGVVSLLSARAEARDVTLATEATATIVRGDRARLHEAVFNLADNALAHSPDGGRVTIAIAPAPPGCLSAERVEKTGARSWVPIVFPLEGGQLVWLAFDLDQLQFAIHPIVSEVTFTQLDVGLLRRDDAPITVAGQSAPDWPDGPPEDGVLQSLASHRLPVDVAVATLVDDGAVEDARSRMGLVAASAVVLAFALAFGRAWWRRHQAQAPTTAARRS